MDSWSFLKLAKKIFFIFKWGIDLFILIRTIWKQIKELIKLSINNYIF